MHAVLVLHLISMSFSIPDQQNKWLSASIFVEPGCPKCSASCLFSSSGNTILSPAISKRNRSVISLKTGENSSGALLFCLFLTHIFICGSFGSAEVSQSLKFNHEVELNILEVFFGLCVFQFRFLNHMVDLNIMYRLFGDIIILEFHDGKNGRRFRWFTPLGA